MHDMDMDMDHCAMDGSDHCCEPDPNSPITEFHMAWPGAGPGHAGPPCHPDANGSTHELVWDRNHGGEVFWVTGQAYDSLARLTLDGEATIYPVPAPEGQQSLPHGIAFDGSGQLWITLEGLSQLARIDQDNGGIVETVDVRIHASDAPEPLATRPHGLGYASDGSLWFTGKLSNSVGRVQGGKVSHFMLPTIGATPIYIAEGPDGNMWCTELTGNMIARITPAGVVTEYKIPTANSRPIAIKPSPDGKYMWFSEEAGGKVGRVSMDGTIDEYPVPLTQKDAILAGLAFDEEGALWVQQYVTPPGGAAMPTANDYIVRMSPEIHDAAPGDLTGVGISYYKAPTRGTVMHRIVTGPDKNIWFTELGVNQVGKLVR